jgi:hypothetical protein
VRKIFIIYQGTLSAIGRRSFQTIKKWQIPVVSRSLSSSAAVFFGMEAECVMSRFLLEIMRKVYREKYYEFRAEFEAVKKLLKKRKIMNYFVYELPMEM